MASDHWRKTDEDGDVLYVGFGQEGSVKWVPTEKRVRQIFREEIRRAGRERRRDDG